MKRNYQDNEHRRYCKRNYEQERRRKSRKTQNAIKRTIILILGLVLMCVMVKTISSHLFGPINKVIILPQQENFEPISMQTPAPTQIPTPTSYEEYVISLVMEYELPNVSSEKPAHKSKKAFYYLNDREKASISKLIFVTCDGKSELYTEQEMVGIAATVLNCFYHDSEREHDIEKKIMGWDEVKNKHLIYKVREEDVEPGTVWREAVEWACQGWDPTRKTIPEGAKHFNASTEITAGGAVIDNPITFW